MALVVPDVCRFAVNGRIFDRPAVNIIDMGLLAGGTTSRSEWIFDTAGNIINSWMEHVITEVVDDYIFDSVSWVDLNDVNGSTGERVSTSQHNLPQAGLGSSDPSPGSVSALVTKQTISSRGQRNGRMYITGIQESGTSGQNLTSTRHAALNSAMDALLDELNDEPTFGDSTRTMVVVHTTSVDENGDPLPEPEWTGTTVVESLSVSLRLATQRRRLRG